MFGRKKKKPEAQLADGSPPLGTPPLNNATPPLNNTTPPLNNATPPLNNATLPKKAKKTHKKEKKKKKESPQATDSPAVTPKKRGFRFGRKKKTPTSSHDTSSLADDSVGDGSSIYQSGDNADLNTRQGSATSYPVSNQSHVNGNLASPSESMTAGSASDSYQEKQSSLGQDYEDKNLEYWDEEDVIQWLRDQGFDYFADIFEGCGIDGEYLLNITDEDLIDLEVDDAVLRKKFLEAIQVARDKQGHSPQPTLDQQLTALSHDTETPGKGAGSKTNSVSEASTIPASNGIEMSRNVSPPPKLVPKKHSPVIDSDSEFDFDSDELGDPLDDLPDNSNLNNEDSSPRLPVKKGVPLRNSIKERESPRSPADRTDLNAARKSTEGSKEDTNHSAGKLIDSPSKSTSSGRESVKSFTMTDPPEHSKNTAQTSIVGPRLGPTRSRSESVVTKWSESDVVTWLQESQLNHLKKHFLEHKVTGKQLLNIDMQLLDAMAITSDDDRELLLAKLYELNNPTANKPEKELISALNNTSGYEHKKYMAAMKVLQSSDNEEVQILPPETKVVRESFSGCSRTASSASDLGREEKRKKGGLSILRGVISPKRQSRDYNFIQVWTDIMRSGVTTVSLRLTESETISDLIKLCLNQLDLIEDWRMYCILDAAGSLTDRKDWGFERVMDDSEHPVVVQEGWSERSPRHFELRQKPAQGGSIKIVLHLDDDKPKGKLLAISLSTPAKEVVTLGLLRFGLKEAHPNEFCLLEVDKGGDLHDVEDSALPLQSDSHAFVLCRTASKHSHLAPYDDDEKDGVEREPRVKRSNSLQSRTSSNNSLSAGSLGSSLDSDQSTSFHVDDGNLNRLEKEMATIDESLSLVNKSNKAGGKDFSSHHITDPEDVSKVMKEKDATIDALRRENKTLQEKAKQLAVVQKALGQLEQTYKQNETDSKQRVQEKRQSITAESVDSLPKAISDVQSQLHRIGEEINKKKLNILKIQQQQKQIQGRTLDSMDRSIQQAELDYRIALEESSMLTLQQQQAQLLAKLELALTDHQVAMEKKMRSEQFQPLFPTLQASHHYSLHKVAQSKNKRSFRFTLVAFRDGKGAVVQRCSKETGLIEGDRVLELNGEGVSTQPISEINQILTESTQLDMVLLRESNKDAHDDKEEMTRLQEQLESMQNDNDRLGEEIERLKGLKHEAKQASQLQITVQQLQKQLSDSKRQADTLDRQLADRDNEHTVRQIQDEKHMLQMEVIQLKEMICKLEDGLDEKTNDLAMVSRERDMAVEELMSKTQEQKSVDSGKMVSEALEEGLPLWEALKSASKPEILEVLREELEEAARQKEYLDQLYSLMLEKAPNLLAELEEDFQASELSNTEEFC